MSELNVKRETGSLQLGLQNVPFKSSEVELPNEMVSDPK